MPDEIINQEQAKRRSGSWIGLTFGLLLLVALIALGGCSKNSANSGNTKSSSGTVVKNSLGMEFVKIPAGSFTMGSPESEPDRYDGELQHQVTLSKDFFLSKYETTQAQWKAVMGDNPSDSAKECGDNCPVDYVSWDDVQGFITKLNAKGEGTYRLPTEAEWEYACRAGKTGVYSGDNLDDVGWYTKNSDHKIHPVGQKKANDFGLYDMHGNVTEWTADWGGGLPSSESVTDPKGQPTGHNRVMRGGNAFSDAKQVRSAYSSAGSPSGHFNYVGFRLVKE